jgi:hypothetical protein
MEREDEDALGKVGDSGGVVILETKEKMLDAPDGRRETKLLLVLDLGKGVFGLDVACKYRSV